MIQSFKFKILVIVALLLTGARFSFAGGGDSAASAPTREQVLEKYSYEELQAVSSYFTAREDAEPMAKGKKILVCDPSMKKVRQWSSGSVRSLMDEKRINEVATFKKDPAAYLRKAETCSESCMCNAYALVLSDAEAELGQTEIYKKLDELLGAEAKKETKAVTRSCAEKAKWFCESDLLKYLKSEN